LNIRRLGENLFQVDIAWWKWSTMKELAKAIVKIQGEEGKVVTAISKQGYSFLVCTMGKA